MAGDQLVAPSGVTHISLPLQEYDRGSGRKREQTNKHEQCLGLTQSRRRVCNTTFMCRLTLAWVTSENSTKQLECRHLLTRSSSLDPIFSAGLTAPVSGVDCPCPWFHANSSQLLSPTNSCSCPLTTSEYGEISGPKTLCLVSRQNRQRNRLLGGPPI